MTSEYAHGLASDMRQRHAMSTSVKVGGAYSGWRPKDPSDSLFSGHIRSIVWAGIAAGAVVLAQVFAHAFAQVFS